MLDRASAPPEKERYFEDFAVGWVGEYGSFAVTEEEVIDFARRYDPQFFHVDAEAAARSSFGGLIASGWHTAAMMMRLLVDNVIASTAALGSPGVDEVRWPRPVRPGDKLSIRVTVRSARRSRSKPDRGVVGFFVEVVNGQGQAVMTLRAMGMYRCRDRKAGAEGGI
jgi:acyl dehydratase